LLAEKDFFGFLPHLEEPSVYTMVIVGRYFTHFNACFWALAFTLHRL